MKNLAHLYSHTIKVKFDGQICKNYFLYWVTKKFKSSKNFELNYLSAKRKILNIFAWQRLADFANSCLSDF